MTDEQKMRECSHCFCSVWDPMDRPYIECHKCLCSIPNPFKNEMPPVVHFKSVDSEEED